MTLAVGFQFQGMVMLFAETRRTMAEGGFQDGVEKVLVFPERLVTGCGASTYLEAGYVMLDAVGHDLSQQLLQLPAMNRQIEGIWKSKFGEVNARRWLEGSALLFSNLAGGWPTLVRLRADEQQMFQVAGHLGIMILPPPTEDAQQDWAIRCWAEKEVDCFEGLPAQECVDRASEVFDILLSHYHRVSPGVSATFHAGLHSKTQLGVTPFRTCSGTKDTPWSAKGPPE